MFFLVLALIILFVMVFRLGARVDQLEYLVGIETTATREATSTTSATPAVDPSSTPTTASAPLTPAPTPVPAPSTPVVSYQAAVSAPTSLHSDDASPDWFERFTAWLGDNTLIKIGAFFFFLGAIWFVTYAIGQGWISEWLRVMLGIGFGLGIAVLGHVRYRPGSESPTEYNTLTVLGGAIVIGAIYAGQFLYLVFPPLLALLLLVASIAYLVAVSLRTQTEWLTALAALASLAAPLLINEADPSVAGFFSYLFVMALGVSAVVYTTTWRIPLLVIVVGTYGYLVTAIDTDPPALLWIFTIWFALLYFVSTSVSLWRTREPHPLDLTTIGITTMFFAFMANQLALVPAVALFMAALVAAAVGYAFRQRGVPDRITVVYAVAALFSLFVGTSMLFSGYTLALAFTFEVAVILCAGVHLGFSAKTLGTMAALWVVPIITTLPLLYAPAWERGIIHPEGLAVYLVAFAISITAAYTLQAYHRTQAPHLYGIAAYLTGLAWLVSVVALGMVSYWIDPAQNDGWYVLAYLGWLGLTLFGLVLTAIRSLPQVWLGAVLLSGLLPVVTSLASVVSARWDTGIVHIDAFGLLVITAVFGLVGALCYARFLVHRSEPLGLLASGALVTFFAYATGLLWLVSNTVADTTLLANTLALTGNTLLSYLLFVALFRTGAPHHWSLAAVWSLLIPVLYSITSLVTVWTSPAEPHAIALYVLVTVIGLIAITLKAQPASDPTEQQAQQALITTLVVGVALYAVRIVWLAMHAVFASSDYAVTAALLVYTLAGLIAYVYGNQMGDRSVKLAGILLLALVIGRLLLIEVWSMELLWRVVTFLGVGGLFIAAALFERDHRVEPPQQTRPPQA